MDIAMPRLNGLEATRQILAQKLDETAQGRLIDEAIRELPGKLN
jgi:CheY-like chemotaxis protein